MANNDIQGQITGPDGNPVEGAKVYLFREDATTGSANSVATATTDANGEYIFTGHPDDTDNLEKWIVTAKYESGGDQYQYSSLWGVEAAIGPQPFYAVTLNSTNSPVSEGEIMNFNANIDNTEPVGGNKSVELQIATFGIVDSQSLQLGPNGSKDITLSWDTTGATAQDYATDLQTVDDSVEPTVTVEPGTTEVVYGFETGDFSRWAGTQSLDSINTTRVYEGTYSGFQGSSNSPVGRLEPSELSGGAQPETISWAYQETSSGSVGGAVSIHDSTDAVICGAGSSNPDHEVNYANGWNRFGAGNGYDRWVVYELSFDWTNGTFVATAEDTQANETFTSSSLALGGSDVEALEIRPFSLTPDFDTGQNPENWWDSFKIVV